MLFDITINIPAYYDNLVTSQNAFTLFYIMLKRHEVSHANLTVGYVICGCCR